MSAALAPARFISPLGLSNNQRQYFPPPYLGRQRRIESVIIQALSNLAGGGNTSGLGIGHQSINPLFSIGAGSNNALEIGQFQLVQPQLWLPGDSVFCDPSLIAQSPAAASDGVNMTTASATTSTVIPVTGNVPIGDVLVAIARNATAGATFSLPTDTGGNVWTLLANCVNATSSQRVNVWISKLRTALTTADTITVTCSAAINQDFAVQGFTGLTSSTYGAVCATGNGTAPTAAPSLAVTQGDLVIGVSGIPGANTLPGGSLFTQFSAAASSLCAAYYIAPSTGAITFTSSGASAQWEASALAITAAPVAGPSAMIALAGTETG